MPSVARGLWRWALNVRRSDEGRLVLTPKAERRTPKAAGLLALCALLLAFPGVAAAREDAPDGLQLLRWSAEQSPHQPIAGRQVNTSWTGTAVERTETVEYGDGHGRERSEILLPRTRVGRIEIENGHGRWLYDSRTRVLVHSLAPDEDDVAPDFALLAGNYRLEVAPEPVAVAGRPAWVVTASAALPGKPWRRLWIDQEKGIELKVEKRDADGRRQSRTGFTAIGFPASLPRALFNPPVGVRVRQERSEGVELPARLDDVRSALGVSPASELASGYHLREVAAISDQKDTIYHLRYDDGLSVLSLFLSRSTASLPGIGKAGKVALANGTARLHEGAHFRVLSWSAGPVHCALVGDASAPLMKQLADSTGCARGAAVHEAKSLATDRWLLVPAVIFLVALFTWSGLFLLSRRQRSMA